MTVRTKIEFDGYLAVVKDPQVYVAKERARDGRTGPSCNCACGDQ